jgi:hypothetical protein
VFIPLHRAKRRKIGFALSGLALVLLALILINPGQMQADFVPRGRPAKQPACRDDDNGVLGGSWFWMRSPDEEKRHVMGLFSRYCIRCHGADGSGVWDIPDVPNFKNAKWQSSRSDAQLSRIIIEGRGAVMPPFRGTVTLEESWALARHLRSFVPGTELLRPEFKEVEMLPEPGKKKVETPK